MNKYTEKIRSLKLCSLALISLNLADWTPTEFPFKKSPSFKQVDSGIYAHSTGGEIGGYAKAIPSLKLSATSKLKAVWNITKYPSVEASHPVKKGEDDFPLRIGLVISDGKRKAKIPWLVRRKIPIKKPISYIIYYSPVIGIKNKKSSCAKSPHNDYSVYCLIPSAINSDVSVDSYILEDLKSSFKGNSDLSIEGIWILTDTDNTNSATQVNLQSLSVRD